MTRITFFGLFVALVFPVAAQPPVFPKPDKEHEWLQKALVGSWEGEGQCMIEPGKTVKCKGTETCKAVGSYWVVSDIKGEFSGTQMTGVMTLGYDSNRKVFIGSWIDSTSGHLYKYTGSIDSAGKVLTLESEGPNPKEPDMMMKMKDVITFKSDTEKEAKSYVQDGDKWIECMTMTSKKK